MCVCVCSRPRCLTCPLFCQTHVCFACSAPRSLVQELARCECDGLPPPELPQKLRSRLAAPLPAQRRGQAPETPASLPLSGDETLLSFSPHRSHPGPEAERGRRRPTGETSCPALTSQLGFHFFCKTDETMCEPCTLTTLCRSAVIPSLIRTTFI